MRLGPPVDTLAQRLFWAWAVQFGVAIFAAWWLHTRGLWRALVEGDLSGISVAITLLSLVVTLWCGRRAGRLQAEAADSSAWRQAYAQARAQSPGPAAALLSEHSHGSHETASRFAASAIKLGLLGCVVGFVFMASRSGSMPSFDADPIQKVRQGVSQTATGEPKTGPKGPSSGFLPLESGHRWAYDVKTECEDNVVEHEDLVLTTKGSDTLVDGGAAYRRRSDDGVDYWLRSDDAGIYRLASKSDLDAEPKLDAQRRYVLKAPLAAGSSSQATTTA